MLFRSVPERVWVEIRRAMRSAQPSVFIRILRECDALAELLPEVDALYGVPQPEQHHPEVDTGLHVEMCLDIAASMGCSANTAFAVLLHDLGKGMTPRDQWPRHIGHEHSGLSLIDDICARYRVPKSAQRLARQVCSAHLRAHRILEARPETVMKLLEQLDAIRSGDIEDFLQACECDYRGRKGLEARDYPQANYLRSALSAACSVNARDLDLSGIDGIEIGAYLREARIGSIAKLSVQATQQKS